MSTRRPPDSDNDPTLELLERAAPWIMVGLVVVLVLTAVLAAILGAPWMR